MPKSLLLKRDLNNLSCLVNLRLEKWDVSPCFMFGVSPHQYRYQSYSTDLIFISSSFGYETPSFTWYLNDVALKPDEHFIVSRLSVKVPHNGELVAEEQEVQIHYTITQAILKLTIYEGFNGVYTLVKVAVNESSKDVIQSLYPERTIWTAMTVNNVLIEWDQSYNDAVKLCAKRVNDLNDQYSITKSPSFHGPNPGPEWGINTIDVINQLVQTNPVVANAVINEVSRLANVSRLEVMKRLR